MDECKKHLSFKERELVILRETIDKIDEEKGRQLGNSSGQADGEILERFFATSWSVTEERDKHFAEADQFYDRRLQIPDYDFFSKTPVDDAKELADIYAKEGFDNVEAKAGVHYGTYKVFVDFIPIADITLLDKRLFNNLFKDSIRVNGIYYTPPNYLRMSMYLELSRPAGDVSRWEKVLKRLILLNKNYPLKSKDCGADVFFRRADDFDKEESEEIHDIVLGALADQGVVFFGGYASSLLSKYMPAKFRKMMEKQPDFDVLSLRPEETATIVKERLEYNEIRGVKVMKHDGLGEVIPSHYEVRIGSETVAFIYEPIACHSYNEIEAHGMRLKVASIDTILSLYLAFLYADRKYYDQERILCVASFLFDVRVITVNWKGYEGSIGMLWRAAYNWHHPDRSWYGPSWKIREAPENTKMVLSYKPGTKSVIEKWTKRDPGKPGNIKRFKSRKLRAKCNTTRKHHR